MYLEKKVSLSLSLYVYIYIFFLFFSFFSSSLHPLNSGCTNKPIFARYFSGFMNGICGNEFGFIPKRNQNERHIHIPNLGHKIKLEFYSRYIVNSTVNLKQEGRRRFVSLNSPYGPPFFFSFPHVSLFLLLFFLSNLETKFFYKNIHIKFNSSYSSLDSLFFFSPSLLFPLAKRKEE